MTKPEIDLINEKFSSLHSILDVKFTAIAEKLESIEAQTLKTNGRVTKLEDSVKNLQLNEALHVVNCPQNKKFEEIDKKYQDLNFFLRHPNVFVGVIVFLVLISLSALVSNNPFSLFGKEKDKTEAAK